MNKLKEYRIKNKYSLKDMSIILGISKTYYYQIENHSRNLTYAMAIKISKIFNLKPDDLFYNDYI